SLVAILSGRVALLNGRLFPRPAPTGVALRQHARRLGAAQGSRDQHSARERARPRESATWAGSAAATSQRRAVWRMPFLPLPWLRPGLAEDARAAPGHARCR